MDGEREHASNFPNFFGDFDQQNSSSHSTAQSYVHCIFCRRAFPLESHANGGSEPILICSDCKLTVLCTFDVSTSPDSGHRRQQRVGSQSSESVDELFSHHLEETLDPLLQHIDVRRSPGSAVHRNFSRRWQHTSSDNGSDAFDPGDSSFGENDSNISITGFGGESDASLNGLSLGRELFDQQDAESHAGDNDPANDDTDIDPMHAGLDRWNSDDQDEDEEWEEADVEQERQIQSSGGRSAGNSSRFSEDFLLWRQHPFAGLIESEESQYVGNPGDYLDARGFEELLDRLAETDNSRRGAPPASASFVKYLPQVIVTDSFKQNASLVCAVCKDPILAGSIANQLPCRHLYHPECILPWLSMRNSCPVCRYELPTDDPDYKRGKRNIDMMLDYNEIQQHSLISEGSSIEASNFDLDEPETNESSRLVLGRVSQGDVQMEESEVVNTGNAQPRRRGRLYLAVVPIVGIVGLVLSIWLQNSQANTRINQLLRSRRSTGQEGQISAVGRRRWWFF